MKKFLIFAASIIVASQSVVAEEVQFVSDSMSSESQACIDVASGNVSLHQLAENLGVSKQVLDRRIQCNGMAISRFAHQFKQKSSHEKQTLTANNFALDVKHANDNAQLCAIAASGNMAKLQRLTRAQGISVKHFIKHNTCNDRSVSEFVRQFGGEQAAQELQKHI